MIPLFWLEPLVSVYATVAVAVMTGGNPGMAISEDGIRYLVGYDRD